VVTSRPNWRRTERRQRMKQLMHWCLAQQLISRKISPQAWLAYGYLATRAELIDGARRRLMLLY